jgi:zinc transport system substrate-binding protein
VATIAPLHSLVAAVMKTIAGPALLLRGGVSPHDYRLRPSDMRALSRPDVVFWIGPEFETFLAKPLANAADVRSVALAQAAAVELLPLRSGGIWQAREHEGQGHDDTHDAGDFDTHIWLDPRNAAAMTRAIAAALSDVDPANAAVYRGNRDVLLLRLSDLEQDLHTLLAPVRDQPYIVFHDAYQYFERRFGLQARGSITLDPERRPGARRVSEIRARIETEGIRCVFSEPQFEPALVSTLIEGTGARQALLDPLGTGLTPGAEMYFQLLRDLAQALRECLS